MNIGNLMEDLNSAIQAQETAIQAQQTEAQKGKEGISFENLSP